MNWNDLLKKYFVETLEYVKGVAPTIKNEASLYIEELIKWEIWSNGVLLALCCVFLALSIAFIVWACKSRNMNEDHVDGIIISICIALIAVAVGVDSGLSMTKAIVAPRVVIMEKLQEAVK